MVPSYRCPFAARFMGIHVAPVSDQGSCMAPRDHQWLMQNPNVDVGQNGRPRGPQMEMSSLVLTIHNFGVPNFDPYPMSPMCGA